MSLSLVYLVAAVSLPSPADLGLSLGGLNGAPAGSMAPLDDLTDLVIEQGCDPQRFGLPKFRFAEAQIGCLSMVGYAQVARALRGESVEQSKRAVSRLLAASQSASAMAPFTKRAGLMNVGGVQLPASGLYRGFLLLLTAGAARIGALDEVSNGATFDALASSLVTSYSTSKWLPSLGKRTWPCDNAIIAAALHWHGALRKNHESAATAQAVTQRLESALQRRGGFPFTVTPQGSVVNGTERATALAWTAGFLSMARPRLAARFTDRLVDRFCDRRAVGGERLAACREYRRGVTRAADHTSGPIVAGYAVAASALAIAATGGTERDAWHQSLMRLGYRVGLGQIVAHPTQFPLENAILHWSRSVRNW